LQFGWAFMLTPTEQTKLPAAKHLVQLFGLGKTSIPAKESPPAMPQKRWAAAGAAAGLAAASVAGAAGRAGAGSTGGRRQDPQQEPHQISRVAG
jgi:hypothetical protein